MAALLAVTIQIITNKNFFPSIELHNASIEPFSIGTAMKNPIKANGKAKMVCENLMRLK
jgi:hypothetical protein